MIPAAMFCESQVVETSTRDHAQFQREAGREGAVSPPPQPTLPPTSSSPDVLIPTGWEADVKNKQLFVMQMRL